MGVTHITDRDNTATVCCYDLNEQKINHAYQPLVGRVHFINGDAQQFTDATAYLDCIREELPHEATTGFRFRTITQNPVIRKAVDDIVYDFYHATLRNVPQRCILETPVWIYPGCNTEQLKMLVKLLRLVNSSPSGKTRWADKQ